MIDLHAWVICDTDGGRNEADPMILFQHISESEQTALNRRNYVFSQDLHPYYPIKKIRIVEALDQ